MRYAWLTLALCALCLNAQARYEPLALKQYASAKRAHSTQELLFLHDENYTSYVHLCFAPDETACGGAPNGTYRTADNVTFRVYRGLLEDMESPELSCDYVRDSSAHAHLECMDRN